MSPAEREEFLKKIEDVKRRKDLGDLKRRRNKARDLWKKIIEELDPEKRAMAEGLYGEERDDLRHFCIGLFFEMERKTFRESLSEEERTKLDRHKGPDWFRVRHEIEQAHVLAGMPAEERARIAALPEARRCESEREAVRDRRMERHARIRKMAAVELGKLLDLPAEERARRIFPFRVRSSLFRLGIRDHELLGKVGKMPRQQLEKLDREIREISAIPDRDERLRAVKKLKARLGRSSG